MARRRKIDPERKAFINNLLEHYQRKDAQDVQEMLKDLLGETLQGMLEAEMEDQVLSIYAKGMANRDISAHLRDVYRVEASSEMISCMTDCILLLAMMHGTKKLTGISWKLGQTLDQLCI